MKRPIYKDHEKGKRTLFPTKYVLDNVKYIDHLESQLKAIEEENERLIKKDKERSEENKRILRYLNEY